MFGFVPDLLLIAVGAGLFVWIGRTVERRAAKRGKPDDTAEKFS